MICNCLDESTSCLRFVGTGRVKGWTAGDLCVVVVVHGNIVEILSPDAFLLSLKCKLHMYVYDDTLIRFWMLTNHWCLLLTSVGSLWNDKCSHSVLLLLLVHPGIEQFFGITCSNRILVDTLHFNFHSSSVQQSSTKYVAPLHRTFTLSQPF